MQEDQRNKYPNDFDGEINLTELFYVIWDGKWIITSLTVFASTVGVIYSLLLPNIYESKTLLAPVSPSSSITGALRNYSGLAGLAGITLPSSVDEGNSIEAIQKISSLSFFENNILPNIFLPDLMAVKSWNSKANTLFYNESIYNVKNGSWIGGSTKIPSAQQSFEVFKTHFALSEDRISGFVTLSIKHQSPFVAKQWAKLVVDEINNFYRQKDKSESEKAANYLNQQISLTGLSEIKEVLAQLLQEETKKLTLIEANKSYVFDFVDPPAVMEKKSEPKRALISILSFLLGGMISILLVLIRHYASSKRIS